jgi:dienelactone hydrolase
MRRTRGTTARLLSVLLAVVAAGWLGARASDSAALRLNAGPATEAFVMPIHVTVDGLYPGEKVTVRGLSRDSSGALWTSWASFTAESGTLDLARSVPEAGTYQVADAGGLLWSLQPPATGSQVRHIGGPGNGFTVQVQVLIGGEVVAEQTLTRSVLQPAQNLDVASTGFHGSLYLPPKPTASPTTPAVVVIGGSEGGVPAPEAAGFAAAGYPSLALGYFGEPDLPRCLCSIPLEYFAHAVAWLRSQPGFADRPVVLWGASRGGEGALVLAAYEPKLFDEVIAVAPSYLINRPVGLGATQAPSAWTLNGQPLPEGPIPVAGIQVPVLLTAGGADVVWDSSVFAPIVMARLDITPGAPAHHYLAYPDAGHAMAGIPPYVPVDPTQFGGTQGANASAAESAWPQMIAFIHQAARHSAP